MNSLYKLDMDIQMFIEAAIQSSKDVDYSEKSEIRTHNQAIDCYRKIAKNIDANYPDRLSDFSMLLKHENVHVRLCCAICMIELMNFSIEQKKRAIYTVQKYIDSTNDSIEKAGLNVWLKKQKHLLG